MPRPRTPCRLGRSYGRPDSLCRMLVAASHGTELNQAVLSGSQDDLKQPRTVCWAWRLLLVWLHQLSEEQEVSKQATPANSEHKSSIERLPPASSTSEAGHAVFLPAFFSCAGECAVNTEHEPATVHTSLNLQKHVFCLLRFMWWIQQPSWHLHMRNH